MPCAAGRSDRAAQNHGRRPSPVKADVILLFLSCRVRWSPMMPGTEAGTDTAMELELELEMEFRLIDEPGSEDR